MSLTTLKATVALRKRKGSAKMANPFFDHPILNSPYDCPKRHWELDDQGQPTQRIIETRLRAEFITPIPNPKKPRRRVSHPNLPFHTCTSLSTHHPQHDPT